jgi:hypothetical protein
MENQHRGERDVAPRSQRSRREAVSDHEEIAVMDRKTHGPRKDRPKTERPPETASKPKGGEGQQPSDIERATERDSRDFDPNVNQRPR